MSRWPQTPEPWLDRPMDIGALQTGTMYIYDSGGVPDNNQLIIITYRGEGKLNLSLFTGTTVVHVVTFRVFLVIDVFVYIEIIVV